MSVQKTMDVMYVIDATGSMSSTIKAAHDRAAQISVDLKVKNMDVDFKFGSVCYRDPVDCRSDIHEFKDLTSNIDNLVDFFNRVKATGGGDGPEDVYGGLKITLERTSWRKGPKAIIFIADAPAHGRRYCGVTNHEDQTNLLPPLLKKIAENDIAFSGMSINGGCDLCLTKMKEDYDKYRSIDGPEFMIEKLDLNNYSHSTEKSLTGDDLYKSDDEDDEEAKRNHGGLTDSLYIQMRMAKRTSFSCAREIKRFYESKSKPKLSAKERCLKMLAPKKITKK